MIRGVSLRSTWSACESDPSLSADDPACGPVVEGVDATPPSGGDPGAPDDVLPSQGNVAPEQLTAPEAVAGATLPRTGGSQGMLITAAVALVLLGLVTLAAQRATRPKSRGAHVAQG